MPYEAESTSTQSAIDPEKKRNYKYSSGYRYGVGGVV